MTETPPQSSDASISTKMERVRDIIAQLDAGDVSLEQAKALHDEGHELLADIEADLDLGEGSIIENR